MSFSEFMKNLFPAAILQTMYMIIVPTIVATAIGFIIAVVLVLTKEGGLKENKLVTIDASKNIDEVFASIKSALKND